MLKSVEARGCIFQWINKPFKVLCFCLSCLPLHYVESSITLAFLLWIIVFAMAILGKEKLPGSIKVSEPLKKNNTNA